MINTKIINLCEQILTLQSLDNIGPIYVNLLDLSLSEKIEFLQLPKGASLYSPAYGDVTFERLNTTEPKIVVKSGNSEIAFYSDGKLSPNGECLLFPEKNKRDFDREVIEKKYVLNFGDNYIINFFNKYAKYSKIRQYNEESLESFLTGIILSNKLYNKAQYLDSYYRLIDFPQNNCVYFLVYDFRSDTCSISLKGQFDKNLKFKYAFRSKAAAEKFIDLFKDDISKYFCWKSRL